MSIFDLGPTVLKGGLAGFDESRQMDFREKVLDLRPGNLLIFREKVLDLRPKSVGAVKTREGFSRKNIVAVSFFSKLFYTPIFLIHVHVFSIKRNHSSMNIFSIYIHTCPVNIHCHFNCTDRFRAET